MAGTTLGKSTLALSRVEYFLLFSRLNQSSKETSEPLVGEEEEASKSEREHRLEKNFQAANFPSRNTHTDDIQLRGGAQADDLCNFILQGKDLWAFETAGMQPAQHL